MEETPGNWKNARDFYMTVNAQIRLMVNESNDETKNTKGKYLVVVPRKVEISSLKMFKEDEE